MVLAVVGIVLAPVAAKLIQLAIHVAASISQMLRGTSHAVSRRSCFGTGKIGAMPPMKCEHGDRTSLHWRSFWSEAEWYERMDRADVLNSSADSAESSLLGQDKSI